MEVNVSRRKIARLESRIQELTGEVEFLRRENREFRKLISPEQQTKFKFTHASDLKNQVDIMEVIDAAKEAGRPESVQR
jgi:hypothetical protein